MTNSTPTAIRAETDAIPQWQTATWEDYLAYRDAPTTERVRLFFNQGYLFVDMGSEGIDHARFRELIRLNCIPVHYKITLLGKYVASKK